MNPEAMSDHQFAAVGLLAIMVPVLAVLMAIAMQFTHPVPEIQAIPRGVVLSLAFGVLYLVNKWWSM